MDHRAKSGHMFGNKMTNTFYEERFCPKVNVELRKNRFYYKLKDVARDEC